MRLAYALPVLLLVALGGFQVCAPLSSQEESGIRPGLEGFAVLPDGAPAAGATVFVSRRWDPWHVAAEPEWLCGRAVCDERGAFRITGLPMGPRLFLRISALDSACPAGELWADSPEVRNIGAIHLTKTAQIAGRVVDPAGKPLAGAEVFFGTPPLALWKGAITGEDGTFRFPAAKPERGQRFLLVRRQGRLPDMREYAGEPLGDIALEPAPLVRLRFVGYDALPTEELLVWIGAARSPGLSVFRPFPRSGVLQVYVPAAPPFAVVVSSRGGPGSPIGPPLLMRDDILPGDEPVVLDLGEIPWVTGTVKDADTGEPVTVLEAGLLPPERRSGPIFGDPRFEQTLFAQDCLPGTFRFPRPLIEKARLLLRTADHGIIVTDPRDLTAPIELRAPRAARIHITLTGEEGRPSTVALWVDKGRVRKSILLKEVRPRDGAATFVAPLPGNYRVSVHPLDLDGAYVCSGLVEVGEEDVRLSLPLLRGGTVMGKVVTGDGEAVPWARIEIEGDEDGELFYKLKRTGTCADSKGHFLARGLRPGKWRLKASRVSGLEFPAVEVTVEPGKTTEAVIRAR